MLAHLNATNPAPMTAEQAGQSLAQQPQLYDRIFFGATVLDGSGAAAVVADVAVQGERIAAIGSLTAGTGRVEIAAQGLVLAPGFIDVHTHDDLELIRNPAMLAKLSQGVTTVITGNCGISAAPADCSAPPPDPMNLLGQQAEFAYHCFAEYTEALKQAKPGVNVAALVGHTTLRHAVMTDLSKAATVPEQQQMQQLLREALGQGALGLSSGLAYHNAIAAPAAELATVGAPLAEFQAIYTSHLRSEFNAIIPALAEAADLGLELQVPVVISHLKCAGKPNWGRASEVLEFIGKRAAQQHFCCDCYPYSASSSTLDLKQVTADFEIFITWSEPYPTLAGQTLAQIAAGWQLPLLETAARLMPAGAVYHGMSETDVQQFLSYPPTMIGSDGLPCDPHPHPRLWGAFPRVLGHYSRDLQLFSLSQAIHKMTGLSAQNFKLQERGGIKVGNFADLVLFDAEKVKDNANFVQPFAQADGIVQVYVNGGLAFDQGLACVERHGRFLAHQPQR